MRKPVTAIAYLDGPRLMRALSSGIRHVFQRREYLNRINVFPVPDGDTGTNMAFTFKTVLEATASSPDERVDELMAHVADAALDGARGNSGAIMAQYFQGFSEAVAGHRLLTPERFAKASVAGAVEAWKAMSKPVPGTLPTVLEDFSEELGRCVADGVRDIQSLLERGLLRARESLANTPNQLPVLRQAGVVDAGGQGFVDLLDGIWTFIQHGAVDDSDKAKSVGLSDADLPSAYEAGELEHRYCTECVLEGEDLDREQIMARLEAMDSSSLVVAGGRRRIRVHVHVNKPADIFLACGDFGKITQQKADDMRRQHGLLNHTGRVAVVTDSGADIPAAEIERLGIHLVPVRLSFGDREFLDGVSLTPDEFYTMLEESSEAPLTSQPPVQDFSRQYRLLTSHGYEVVSVGLSGVLSGTTSAALSAATREETGAVRVFDTLNASCGQGLLAMMAAEAAAEGMSGDEVESLLAEMAPQTVTFGIANDLAYAVRGGRVSSKVKRLTNLMRVNPVLTTKPDGSLGLAGFHAGRGANARKLARTALKKMRSNRMYRILIAHANDPEGARTVRRIILQNHGRLHSCHVTESGPALGVHLGVGGLIIGIAPDPVVLN
jgi:DegV family protein with EDD domain